jgi:hypothetical protein
MQNLLKTQRCLKILGLHLLVFNKVKVTWSEVSGADGYEYTEQHQSPVNIQKSTQTKSTYVSYKNTKLSKKKPL